MVEINTNSGNTEPSSPDNGSFSSENEARVKKWKRCGLIFTLVGIACLLLFGGWMLYKLNMLLSSFEEFVKCDKQFDVQVVSVNVSRELETRTRTSSTTTEIYDRRTNKYKTKRKKETYQVAIYRAYYDGASDSYETTDLNTRYDGEAEAVYLKGVVWWHGKELPYEQLSVKTFPDYDDEQANIPNTPGSYAIYNQKVQDYAFFNVIATSSIFVSIVCFVIGSIFRKKGRQLKRQMIQSGSVMR